MAAFMVMACVWALLLWFQVTHYLPQQRAIVGCRHRNGKPVPSVPGVYGHMTALVWCCDDCPLQIPLPLVRSRGLWKLPEEVPVGHDETGCGTPGTPPGPVA